MAPPERRKKDGTQKRGTKLKAATELKTTKRTPLTPPAGDLEPDLGQRSGSAISPLVPQVHLVSSLVPHLVSASIPRWDSI